jgi:hypothetical protein
LGMLLDVTLTSVLAILPGSPACRVDIAATLPLFESRA